MSEPTINAGSERCSTDEPPFSLCAHISEINFNLQPAKSTLQNLSSPLHSSPSSDHSTADESSQSSESTIRTTFTTPTRRPLTRAMTSPGVDTLSGFFLLVKNSRFDRETEQNFMSIGCSVITISQALYSHPGLHRTPSLKPRFLQLCEELRRPISDALGRCVDHIWNVSRIKSLTAFTVKPTEDYLWSTYRQRARLVVQHTALPTTRERAVIGAFTQLYNTQVYKKWLDLPDEENGDEDVCKALNKLYDTIMTWHEKYRKWCDHMYDLRYNYMLPLMRQIHASPKALGEIRETAAALARAADLVNQQNVPGMMPVDESVVQALRVRAVARDAASFGPRPPIRRQRTL